MPKDYHSSQVPSWFVSMQRELSSGALVGLAYIGNRADDLLLFANINQATPNNSAGTLLPFGNGRRFMGNASPIADALIGGWQIAGVNSVYAGDSVTLQYNASAAFQVSAINQVSAAPTTIGRTSSATCTRRATPTGGRPCGRWTWPRPSDSRFRSAPPTSSSVPSSSTRSTARISARRWGIAVQRISAPSPAPTTRALFSWG